VTYAYDLFGNVSEETHVKPGSPAMTLKDEKADYDSLGRPASAIDAVSKVGANYTYPLNTPPTTAQAVESVTQDGTGASQLTTNIKLDTTGEESSRQTSDAAGDTVTRTVVTRDSAQRWTQATLSLFGGSGSLTLAHGFDPATGKLASQSGAGHGPGGQTSYGYYSSGAQIGMLQSETSLLAFGPAITSSYVYGSSGTGVGRLTQATLGSDIFGFSYDSFGNLTGETKNGTTSAIHTYDSQGTSRLQSETTCQRTTNYYWDESLPQAYGWRTSQGPSATPHQIQYGYTGNGELNSYTNSDPNNTVSASYLYDETGLRTHSAVTVNWGTQTVTDYGHADDGSLLNLSATRGSATWSVDYLYDEEGIPYAGVYRSSSASAPVSFAIVTDQRGDVLELLDANGKAFAAYRYDAWGVPTGAGNCDTGVWSQETRDSSNNVVVSSAVASEIAKRQVLKFSGYVFDSDSGLYYCSARYYDPATRQWLTGDPEKADGEASAYQYCQGDPVEKVDPTGQYSIKYSQFWCGYVQVNGSCRGAEGSFSVRKTTVNKYGNGTWIGMGGFGFHKLLQAGINQKSMKAWWEKVDPALGNDPVNWPHYIKGFKVNQNDVMHVKIIKTGKNKYFLRIHDRSTGSGFKKNVYGFEPQKTADFIEEVKGYIGHFGTIMFRQSTWWTKDGRQRNLASGGGLYKVMLSNDGGYTVRLKPSRLINGVRFGITHK
jgi:RHS repeat-associated protein